MQLRRKYARVCSCTPRKGIVSIGAAELETIVSQGKECICNETDPRKQTAMAIRLGDLCERCGYPHQAIDIWQDALLTVWNYDWDHYSTWFSPRYMRFDHVIHKEDYRALAHRLDRLWSRLGHPEMSDLERYTEAVYFNLWDEYLDGNVPDGYYEQYILPTIEQGG